MWLPPIIKTQTDDYILTRRETGPGIILLGTPNPLDQCAVDIRWLTAYRRTVLFRILLEVTFLSWIEPLNPVVFCRQLYVGAANGG